MLLDVGLCVIEKFHAGMNIGKLPDAEAITRIQLSLQEVAAGISHIRELEQVGGGQEDLHVILVYLHRGSVYVVDEQLQGPSIDTLEGDPRLPRLLETGEHRIEVRTAGGQHHAVSVDLHIVGHQYHITELFLSVIGKNIYISDLIHFFVRSKLVSNRHVSTILRL